MTTHKNYAYVFMYNDKHIDIEWLKILTIKKQINKTWGTQCYTLSLRRNHMVSFSP